MTRHTDITQVLAELDAGLYSAKASKVLAETALAVAEHGEKGRKGKVTLEFTIERIGESAQVQIHHKVAFVRPTLRGKASEEDTTTTPMYVGRGGRLSIAPESQADMFKQEETTNG